ncbi:MAG: hypothetical protein O7B81_14655 [Gammaproteobacteria bacterium]|nr:hypothetical protein [Gammaproteobacteria bacterium]
MREIFDADDFARTKFIRLTPHVAQYKTLCHAAKTHSIPHADFHHTRTMRYLKKHNERPTHVVNTGFFAICELLDCDIAELYITGITFNCEDDYKGYPSYYNTGRRREGPETYNNADGLFEIFKRIHTKDPRIRIDDTLAEIIRLESHGRVEHYSHDMIQDVASSA